MSFPRKRESVPGSPRRFAPRDDARKAGRALAIFFLLLCAALPAIPAHAGQAALHRATLADAEAAVAQALTESGAGDNIEAKASGRPEGALVTHPSPITLSVGELTFNGEERSWDALIGFEAEGRPLSPVRLAGRYDELVEFPVLTHRMSEGEVIAAADISWKRMPASRLRKNAVRDEAQLIGKMPARTISPDRYIREEELASPPVIGKGDIVTLRYRKGALDISTSGEALDAGAPGAAIRVRNSDSGIVVHAVAEGPGEALVSEAGRAGSSVALNGGDRR